MSIVKLGLDIGNSAVKGALLDGSNHLQAEIEIPSVVAKYDSPKHFAFLDDSSFYLQIVDSHLHHDPEIAAIGQQALESPNPLEYNVEDSNYKTGNPQTAYLLFGSLISKMPKIEDVFVKLAVSIPIEEAQAVGLIDDYKDALTGTHTLRVWRGDLREGREIKVTIAAVTIVNEGQAGFYGLLDTTDMRFRDAMNVIYKSLGEDENPISDFSDFIVVDIGEGTTDVSVFKYKKFNPEYSFSVKKGIGNVLEDARMQAAKEQITIANRKELMRVMQGGNKRQEKRRQKWQAFIEPNVLRFEDMITSTIMKAYGMGDYFDAIIFLGGGFSALTGCRVDENGNVVFKDRGLLDKVEAALDAGKKEVGDIIALPEPFARTSNERGLIQLLTIM